MLCDVCGRDNPDNLTFCQDCGRRLKSKAQERVAAPTPPSGLPKIELPNQAPPAPPPAPEAPAAASPPGRPAAAERASSASKTPGTTRSRPEAPAFSFGPVDVPKARPSSPPEFELPITDEATSKAVAEPPPAAAAPPARTAVAVEPAPAAPSDDKQGCPVCDAENPPGYRFCVSCGAPLGGGAAAKGERKIAPAGGAAPASPPAPAEPAPAGDGKIVPSPVLEIAAMRAAPAKVVTCNRCQGQCAAGTRFCKYCGAPLDEPGGARKPAVPGRPVPADAPPAPPPDVAAPAGVIDLVGAIAAPPPSQRPLRPAPSVPPGEGRAPAPLRSVAPASDPKPLPPPVPKRAAEAVAAAVARGQARRLVVIVEDGSEGRTYPLTETQVDIGRLEGDIRLADDPYVSPRHARLFEADGRLCLRDLDSTNKVYVRIRRPTALRDGDLLLLGLEVLQFQTVSEGERGLGHAAQHGTLLFGSPAIARRARLLQRTVEGVTRDVYHLFRDETVIGRETGDIVFTADPFLSRRHAVIRRNPANGEYHVADLDSSNGTYVAIRDDLPLSHGDYVRIGQHLFRVDLA